MFATTYVVGDLEDLQLEVYNFQLLRLSFSVDVVMPCAKLIVDSNPTADFCYLHFLLFISFLFFSAPVGLSGGRAGHTTRAQLRRITSLCT